MDFPTDTRSLERISSHTVDEVLGEEYDNAYGTHAVLDTLINDRGIKRAWNGSDLIGKVVKLEKAPVGGSVAAFGAINMQARNNDTRANFTPRVYTGPIMVDITELQRLGGKLSVGNYLRDTVKDALMALKSDMNGGNGMMGDGSARANDFVGLAGALDVTPSTGTYGGVDRSNANWRNIATDNNATTGNLLADLRTCYNSITFGREMPDVIFTTRLGAAIYESKLTATSRVDPTVIAKGARAGDLGLTQFFFKGVPMVVDTELVFTYTNSASASEYWMLNTGWWEMPTHVSGDFVRRGMQYSATAPLVHQDVIYWHGTVLCFGLRYQGILFDGPAS